MKKNRLSILFISVIILNGLYSSNYNLLAATHDELIALIETAEKQIIEIFVVLSEAENAGADITTILGEVSSVTDYLSEAKRSLNGNIAEEDILELRSTIDSVTEIYKEAVQIKNTAITLEKSLQQELLSSTALRIAVFIIIVYGIWYFFKSYQAREVMKYKPEVP